MNNSSRRSTRFFPLSFSAYFSPLFPRPLPSTEFGSLSLSLPSSLSLGLIRENPLRECLLLRSRSEGRLMKFRDVRVSFNFVVGRWYDRGERSICLWEKKKRIFFFFRLFGFKSLYHDLFYISYRFTFEQIRIKNTIWKSTINPKDQFTFTLPYDSTEINSTTKSSVTNERPPPNESRKQFSFDLHFLSASVAFPRNSQKLGKKSMTSLGRTNESKIVLEGKWS